MDAGGQVPVETRLRPGPLWRVYAVGYPTVLVWTASIGSAFDGDSWALKILVAILALALWQQFTWVSVGVDGITRRWLLRKRWGWDEITGIGWTASGLQAWRFRTARGRWKPVTPWKPLLINSTRDAERQFIDALIGAAAAAGFTPEVVPPWPRGDRTRAWPDPSPTARHPVLPPSDVPA